MELSSKYEKNFCVWVGHKTSLVCLCLEDVAMQKHLVFSKCKSFENKTGWSNRMRASFPIVRSWVRNPITADIRSRFPEPFVFLPLNVSNNIENMEIKGLASRCFCFLILINVNCSFANQSPILITF